MKKLIILSLSFCLLIFQSGCDLTETNVDPTRIHDVELRLLLPNAISQTAFNQTNTTLRIAGTFMQQYRMGAGCLAYTDYVIPSYHFSRYWTDGLYGGSLKDCKVIIDQAKEQEQPYYEGIAKILMAKELGNNTLMFGDLPLSEALKGIENLKPGYDTQEDVLNHVFQLLDEAIVLLDQSPLQGSPASDDLIFGGDGERWVKTAWALKARYFMQMSKRDPEAANKALNALNSGAFTSLEEQPNFQWGINREAGPLTQFAIERPYTMIVDKRFPEKFLVDDPRLEKYTFNEGIDWMYYDNENPSRLHWAAPHAVVPIISYVELAFLKAEALWRTGADAASIQAALEDGVISSMQQLNLEESTYQPYIDAMEQLSVMSRNKQLEYIIEEAYKAYFGYAVLQNWNNYRRTGYPEISPSPYGSHGLNPEGGIPKRYLYPDHEELHNAENLDAAKARQGGALMDAPLWIFE
jgi:hypothetical protein